MIEIFHYTFIQNAIIAGLLVSFMAGIIGSLIVVNRMVFLAGGIAHSSYGGIGLAIFFGFPIFLGASAFAIMSALIIAFVTLNNRHRSDSFIGLIWAVGMAIGIIFVDLTPGYHSDLMSYLFGSILAVDREDIIYMAILMIVILFVIHKYYREILAVSYDSDYAMLRGIPVKFIYITILMLSALTVVVAIKVVGLILVIALMTIPTYIAEKVAKSLYQMMIISGILASVFTMIGLYLSYQYDLTSGATIVISSAVGLLIYSVFARLKRAVL